jgi:hypothetical protein
VRGEGHIDSQPKSGNVKKLFSIVTYKQQELIGKKICIMRSALPLLQRLQPTKRIVHYALFCPFLLEIENKFVILCK